METMEPIVRLSSSSSSSPALLLPRGRSVSLTSHGNSSTHLSYYGNAHINNNNDSNNHHGDEEPPEEAFFSSTGKEQDDKRNRRSSIGSSRSTRRDSSTMNGVVSDSDTETKDVPTLTIKCKDIVAKANGCSKPSPSPSPRSSGRRRSKSRRVSDMTDDGSSSVIKRKGSNGSDADSGQVPTKRKCRSRKTTQSGPSRIKHYVEHNYHDHKYDPVAIPVPPGLTMVNEVSGKSSTATATTSTIKSTAEGHHHHHHKGGVSTPFPERLHQLLEAVDDEDLNHIVGWQPHGRCFIVHKPIEFVNSVMPRFFKQSKLTSFQRQLNLYGFCRLTTGHDRGGYYHELFIRGRVDLCCRMVRTRVKGNGSKAASSPSTEPNFYKMEPCKRGEQTDFLHPEEEDVTTISPVASAEALVSDGTAVTCAADESSATEDNAFQDASRVETPPPIIPILAASNTEDIDTSMSEGASMILDEPLTPLVRPALADDDRNGSFFDLVTAGTAPFVTPMPPSTKSLLDESKFRTGCPPILDPFDDSFFSSFDGVHSGDQIFFEGLPFHYLESKDVEESLHHP